MHRERSCLRARRKRRRSVAPSAADRFGTLPPTLNPLSLDDSEYQSHILSHTLSLLRNIISLFVVTFGGHVQDPLPPGSGLIVRQMNADPWLVAEFLRGPGAAISYLLIGRFWCPSVYLVLNMMSHDCALCDIAHQCDARGVQSRSAKIV